MKARNTVDDRGYLDLMASLFPPASDGGGRIEWDSADYPERVRPQSANRPLLHGADRAETWEPVIRHVAVALCALELTAAPGAMPTLRIRTEEELTGLWLQTLRRLTRAGRSCHLPRSGELVANGPRPPQLLIADGVALGAAEPISDENGLPPVVR